MKNTFGSYQGRLEGDELPPMRRHDLKLVVGLWAASWVAAIGLMSIVTYIAQVF